MAKPRKTKYQQGCDDTRKQFSALLTVAVDMYPQQMSAAAALALGGDGTAIYWELSRLAEKLNSTQRRRRPSKEKVYESSPATTAATDVAGY